MESSTNAKSARSGSGSRRKFARGFTLVEVIVALGVLSLILLATISALRTFANTQASLDRIIGRVDEVRTVSGFIREMLDGAVTGEGGSGGLSVGGTGAGLAYFEGSSNWLEWKTPVLFGEAYGGTMIVRIARVDDVLVLMWQDPPPANAPVIWTDKSSRPLLADVEEFQVSFRSEFDGDWQSGDWDAEGAPALVRLVIKAAGRHWPDLIIRVQR